MTSSPASNAQLRLGILLHLRRNGQGLAAILRWGYARYGYATGRAGYGPRAHRAIMASLAALIRQYEQLGGQANVLRYVVLTGQGNADQRVPATTRDRVGLTLLLARDPDYKALQEAGLAGLAGDADKGGGGALASIIKLALPLLLKILGGLIARPNDPNDPIPPEYLASDEEEDPGYDEEE